MNKTLSVLGICVGATLTLTTGICTPALAASPTHLTVSHMRSAKAELKTYSDSDVVGLLVFGSGPIAKRYPELAKTLAPHKKATAVSTATIDTFTKQLLAVDPQFHEVVTLGAQAHDPYAARTALTRLSTDISAWFKKHNVRLGQKSDGRNLGQTWVLANAIVASESVLVTDVAGVVVVAFAPDAVTYQFQFSHADKIEVSDWAAALATSLG